MATYFVKRQSKVFGPVGGQNIVELAKSGKLRPRDEVATDKSGPWKPAATISSLRSLFEQSNDDPLGPVSADPLAIADAMQKQQEVDSEGLGTSQFDIEQAHEIELQYKTQDAIFNTKISGLTRPAGILLLVLVPLVFALAFPLVSLVLPIFLDLLAIDPEVAIKISFVPICILSVLIGLLGACVFGVGALVLTYFNIPILRRDAERTDENSISKWKRKLKTYWLRITGGFD